MIIKKIIKNSFYYLDNLRLIYFFKKNFSNNTVAVVGASPDILGKCYGAEIDKHDVVIRINLHQPDEYKKDCGSRTDFRFIGATLLQKHINQLNKLKNSKVNLITTKKNKKILKKIHLQSFYFNKEIPKKIYLILKNIIGINICNVEKPPKSGIIILALLIKYGHCKYISIYGFSTTNNSSSKVLDVNNSEVKKYPKSVLNNHCDPSIDVMILNMMLKKELVRTPSYSKVEI